MTSLDFTSEDSEDSNEEMMEEDDSSEGDSDRSALNPIISVSFLNPTPITTLIKVF